jgi:hypothetical protein
MILPTIRASFGRSDARQLVELLGRRDPELREAARRRLDEEGADSLLDDPRVRNALLTDPEVGVAPSVVFYVLIRQALLEAGVDDRATADFVASVVMAFGQAGRAYRPADGVDEEFHYLVDVVRSLSSAEKRRAFLLRSHLGNYCLWLAGLFPDFLEARTRRGAPGLSYYERMGSTGYRLAADTAEAEALGVGEVLLRVSRDFGSVRAALNQVSDRYLWPGAGDPVARLLREVSTREARP